jgi:hypothetical protein
LTLRCPIAPLTAVIFALASGQALAQGAFPAPLPGQSQVGTANDPAFPPVGGGAPAATISAPPASPFPSGGAAPITGGFSAPPPQGGGGGPAQECMKQFIPLREEAEKRGKMIKAASDRKAGPDVACGLIKNFAQAEAKMITYVEKNSERCRIPEQVTDQLKGGHKNTEALLTRVCTMAQQIQQHGPAGPTLSDVLGSSAALPEAAPAKKGGSAFDTLTGNVLTR